MLTNERQSYQIAVNEARIRLSIHVKKPIFRDLYGKVSLFALKQMLPHYLKVVNHMMKPCTKFFTTTMGLPCAHIMEEHMADGAGVLRLEDIHSHWRIDKTTNERNDENKTESEDENTGNEEDTVEALLRVNEPAIAKPRGQP